LVSLNWEDFTQEAGKTKNGSKFEDNSKLPPYESRRGSYIEIMSPAVLEALRSVVDYAPGYDLGARKVKIEWPYSLLVHYDDALAKYQERFASPDCTGTVCPGKYAHKHISIVRNFVKAEIGTAVEDERKRHARGMATYDMLWLLFPPGIDVLYDRSVTGEYQPYVIGSMTTSVWNGTIRQYNIGLWNMGVDIYHVGPLTQNENIHPFAGEVKINSLMIYPFEYRTNNKVWGERGDARRYFEERGKVFFQLRKPGCWDFRGYTTTFPRLPVSLFFVNSPENSNNV
jgi:hypothetical protein